MEGLTPTPIQDITPVPIDRFNPQLTEFRRMDTSGDEKVTFTEFLLSDKDYIEARSREFHSYDKNKDGVISRVEWEAYFEREGRGDHHHLPSHSHHAGSPDLDHDSFFGGRSPFHNFFNTPIRHEIHGEHEGPQKGNNPSMAHPSQNGQRVNPVHSIIASTRNSKMV
ncbi:unnamed protein product, partial [Mesorhabditis belari]|uniref:EF-hand domain-containing protein n=1 Tax=Mesorhabditis belari TaxID=2138241 RepID=A0AAF3FGK7_9BILA